MEEQAGSAGRQATQNIGTIGHVAHGKSTLVLAVSGVNVSNEEHMLIASDFNWGSSH